MRSRSHASSPPGLLVLVVVLGLLSGSAAAQPGDRVMQPAFWKEQGLRVLAAWTQNARDNQALRYVEKTNQMLETHAWDDAHGGYVRALNRDLSVHTPYKDFTPQGAVLSGYLLYLYHATRDAAYLDQMRRIIEVMLGPMRAPGPPWIYERFTSDWQFMTDASKNTSINVGHNIELAWLLLRLHAVTGTPRYKQEALRLAASLQSHAVASSGAWVTKLQRPTFRNHPDAASWWIQAYGTMFTLSLHEATGDPSALEAFRDGAQFWNRAFVDTTYGGTLLKTSLDGEVTKGAKAVRSKTSYHALEHALLNHLYLSLWVTNEPVTLHHRIEAPEADETLYPLPIATEASIQEVTINGEPWTNVDANGPAVHLPDWDVPLRVTVTLR